MITWGFPPSYSDVVVNDQYFTISNTDTTQVLGTYISVTGISGDIVWENVQGEPQWFPGALQGQTYILGARRILSAATVRGVARSTTATGLVWCAVNRTFNAP
jgi:hypothetical protein